MEFDVFIPARYGSRRLPGKPLIEIKGRPLIQYVYECARASSAARVIVTTDDPRIVDAVRGFGGEVCVTRAEHPTGTDRIAEAVAALKLPDDRIVVNVQGDEPQMPATLIDDVARTLADRPQSAVSTACYPFVTDNDQNDPNVVKVVTGADGVALYFSRAPIPWSREGKTIQALRHIGIYGYRVGVLKKFAGWHSSELERIERLEQLRLLHYGAQIVVHHATVAPGIGIDTREDLLEFEQSLASN